MFCAKLDAALYECWVEIGPARAFASSCMDSAALLLQRVKVLARPSRGHQSTVYILVIQYL